MVFLIAQTLVYEKRMVKPSKKPVFISKNIWLKKVTPLLLPSNFKNHG